MCGERQNLKKEEVFFEEAFQCIYIIKASRTYIFEYLKDYALKARDRVNSECHHGVVRVRCSTFSLFVEILSHLFLGGHLEYRILLPLYRQNIELVYLKLSETFSQRLVDYR